MNDKEKKEKSFEQILREFADNLQLIRDNRWPTPARVFKREGDNFSVRTMERKKAA